MPVGTAEGRFPDILTPMEARRGHKKRSKPMILTNLILSAAATICLTLIVGMLAILVKEHAVRGKLKE